MGVGTLDLVMIVAGYVVLFVWLVFFLKGLKYANIFEGLTENDFPLKEVYFVGYAIVEAIGYKYQSKSDRKLRQQLEILYGSKYADYYIRVVYSQKITISFTVLVIAFVGYELSASMVVFAVLLVFSGLAFYYFGNQTNDKINNRSEEMIRDMSNVVSKLALLTNAGMIFKEAWEATSNAGEGVIYKEMQIAVDNMKNGMSEANAYHTFGQRCVIPEIKKGIVPLLSVYP